MEEHCLPASDPVSPGLPSLGRSHEAEGCGGGRALSTVSGRALG